MGETKQTNDLHIESLGKVVGVFLGGVLFVFTAPILILSWITSYFVWASFREREERKWIRPLIIIVAGFFLTNGVWLTFQYYVPVILGNLFSQKKIVAILGSTLVQNAIWAYFPILAGGFYLFEDKLKVSIDNYSRARQLVIKSFLPFRLVTNVTEILIHFVAGALGVSVKKAGDVVEIIFALIGLIVASQIIFAMGFSITQKTPFISFVMGSVSAYVVLFWYYLFSNRWRSENQSSNANLLSKNNKGIHVGRLLEPKKMDLNLTWNDLNHHIHILGQPGAGKSVLLKNIYAHQIMNGEGLLMLDLKADIDVREDFVSLCTEAGRLDDLILIDLSNPLESCGYNPLLMGNATELKDKIIGSIEWSEPYYKKVSERVLLTVLRGFVSLRDQQGIVPTLEDLCTALSGVQGVSLLAEKVRDPVIQNDIYNFIAGFSKEFSKDLEGLRSDLSLLVQSEFGAIFCKPESLNMLGAIQKRKIVLVNLDGQTYSESAKRFGRLLLADLRSASGAIVTTLSKEDRPKFTVIVDEFSDIISTDDMAKTFVGFLNRCRGSGIGVVIAHQSLGDFKEPTVKSQIMDSTETLFSFVQKDPETAETLASIVGTKESWVKTEQTSQSLFFDNATGMGTRKLVQEYVYHPNVFKNLPTGVAIYAAKKPTRHGVVQVRMLEIPKLHNDGIPKRKTAPPLVEGFSTEFRFRKTEYADSLRKSGGSRTRKQESDLDI